jgi:hypothetical protein
MKGKQVMPSLQAAFAAMHVAGIVPTSQQPCEHPPSPPPPPPPPPAQQTWVGCPHGTQLPATHVAFGSLQLPKPPPPPPPFTQQGPPVCPQITHVPPSPQTVVCAEQKSPADPFPLALPGQQP